MYKNFMIGFTYEGYFYCANVHRYSITPVEYHITILADKSKDGLPNRIILKHEGPGLWQASKDAIQQALLNSIIEEIQKRTQAN